MVVSFSPMMRAWNFRQAAYFMTSFAGISILMFEYSMLDENLSGCRYPDLSGADAYDLWRVVIEQGCGLLPRIVLGLLGVGAQRHVTTPGTSKAADNPTNRAPPKPFMAIPLPSSDLSYCRSRRDSLARKKIVDQLSERWCARRGYPTGTQITDAEMLRFRSSPTRHGDWGTTP